MDPNFYNNLLTIPQKDLHNAIQGGALIALASSLYYLLFGNILGMSGMAGSLVKFPARQASKIKFIVLLGMIFVSALINYLYQQKKVSHVPFDSHKQTNNSTTLLVVSGLLVGFGTELSSGCTSGHGLCGLPRFSLRSFVALMTFLLTAIVTATSSVSSKIPQIPQLQLKFLNRLEIDPLYYIVGVLLLTLFLFINSKQKSILAKLALFSIGIIFGCGLMIAGMSYRSKIYGFLLLNRYWDPSLLFVLMTGVLLNVITFQLIQKYIAKPWFGEKVQNPKGKITVRLILGAILFGLGWGLGGLCPGPYLLSIPNSLKIAFYWGFGFFFAQKLANLIAGEGHKVHVHSTQVPKQAERQQSSVLKNQKQAKTAKSE